MITACRLTAEHGVELELIDGNAARSRSGTIVIDGKRYSRDMIVEGGTPG